MGGGHAENLLCQRGWNGEESFFCTEELHIAEVNEGQGRGGLSWECDGPVAQDTFLLS